MTTWTIRTLGAAVLAITLVAAAPASTSNAAQLPGEAAIVNGHHVGAAEFGARWPFIVAIVNSDARSQYDGQFCAGSLIDDQHVLTAAHCVQPERLDPLEPELVASPSSLRVVAGTRVLSGRAMASGRSVPRRVADIFVHPGFGVNQGEGFRSDVALLRLEQPVRNAATIDLVQAGDRSSWGGGAGGVDAYAAGWGDTDPDDRRAPDAKFPAALRAATIRLRSDATCSSTVDGGYGKAFERATNLCGGALGSRRSAGTDTCQGDSGGPLIVPVGTSWRLAGVTSWGEGCGARTYGAYARVDALRAWIDSIPGATDPRPAVGGPGDMRRVRDLRRRGATWARVRLAWSTPNTGTAPERYAIWRRTLVDGEPVEQLVAITPRRSWFAPAPATRRAAAYTWNVRPLDAAGSSGPSAILQAGPDPDRAAPGTVRAAASATGRREILVRWNRSVDRQSGVARYQVQRRVVGRTRFATTATVGPRARLATVGGLTAGQLVHVRVRAIDHAGNAGRWSQVRAVRTDD